MKRNIFTALILTAVMTLTACTSSAVTSTENVYVSETTVSVIESAEAFIESVTTSAEISNTISETTAASDTSHDKTELETKDIAALKPETTAVQQTDFTDDTRLPQCSQITVCSSKHPGHNSAPSKQYLSSTS